MIDDKYIIKDGDMEIVDMAIIHKQLNIKHLFRNWISNNIKRFDLIENADYWRKELNSTGGRPPVTYEFLLENAIVVIQREKLNAVIGSNNRKEFCFFSKLETILIGADLLWQNKIIYQHRVLSYRIDAFIPYCNLCIEYEETYHNKSSVANRDTERKKEIELEGDYYFIRVREGKEEEGIGEIIKYLIEVQ